jgi:hypothetical protein
MSKLFNRRIITNRQLNFTLSPVDLHNPKEMPYSLPAYQIDGTWNHHQSIVLDIILAVIFKGHYKNYENIPKSWRSPAVIEVNKNFAGPIFSTVNLKFLSGKTLEAFTIYQNKDVVGIERDNYDRGGDGPWKKASFEEHFQHYLKNDLAYQDFIKTKTNETAIFNSGLPFGIYISNLYKNFPVLRKYKKNLYEYVAKISETKFKLNYKVKCLIKAPEYNQKGIRTHPGQMIDAVYEMNDFQQIFSADMKDDLFILTFQSPLGKMVIHNMLVLDTDWVADEVLELGKNSYFIYKRFILNKISGKNPANEIELWFEEIKTFLDLKGKNVSSLYSTIDRALQEICDKGLIKNYNWNKSYTKQRQYKLILDRPTKAVEDKRASQNKPLNV